MFYVCENNLSKILLPGLSVYSNVSFLLRNVFVFTVPFQIPGRRRTSPGPGSSQDLGSVPPK